MKIKYIYEKETLAFERDKEYKVISVENGGTESILNWMNI